MTNYLDIDTSRPSLQNLGHLPEVDYELHRWNANSWEIIACVHSHVHNEWQTVETGIASFTSEDAAQVAWEQVMTCSDADRGVMHFASSTPCWEIKWFDDVTFKVSNKLTRDEAEKDDLVKFYTERAGFPVKVSESPIQHWTENPLFAAE